MWGGISYIIGERVPTVSTLLEESKVASMEALVAITCSNKLNEYGVKTMKENKEMVTKVKGKEEAYVPIVRNRSLSLIAGANLSYV